MEIAFEEETFTPSEAEAITGISTITQRDWRRRGYLAAGDGKWTRYSVLEIAGLFITGILDDLGVRPAVTAEVAEAQAANKKSAAVVVTVFAKNHPKAIDKPELAQGEMPVQAMWDMPSFLVVSKGDPADLILTDNLAEIFDGALDGAIVIDLRSVAEKIVSRAKKSLVRVVVKN